MKPRIQSRAKGKRIEREAAAFLREIGFPSARRGQQHRGGKDSPDVICDELAGVHLEVKGDERINFETAAMRKAVEQAHRDSGRGAQTWGLLWKHNRACWKLTFLAESPAVFATVTGDDIRHALLWLKREADIAMRGSES